MSLKTKLLFGFGSVLFICIIAFASIYSSLKEVGQSYQNLVEYEMYKLSLAHEIQYQDLASTDSIKGIIIDADNIQEKQRYDEYSVKIKNSIEEIKPLLDDERAIQMFNQLDSYSQQLINLEEIMMELAKTDQKKTMEIFNNHYAEIRNIFSANLEEFKQIQLDLISSKVAKDSKFIETRLLLGMLAIITTIFVGIIISITIARRTTKPINEIVKKLEELSSNEGDLTARLTVSSKDEVGQLATAFNKMIETIQHLVRNVKLTTMVVASASQQLSASAEQNATATTKITESIQEIAGGTELQAKQAESSTAATQEMITSIQFIAESSTTVSASSIVASKEAEEGNKVILQSINQMDLIQKTVNAAGLKVKELESLSNDIGHILNVITTIAEQTNLLALNAAIEAARAGEAGKGFAVVADEVRKLAEGSKNSATKITDLIKEIQVNTTDAVDYMNKGEHEVQSGIILVNEAGEAFGRISSSVQQVTEQIQQVSRASKQLTAGTEIITSSIENLVNISNESFTAAQNVAASSQEQLASIEEIATSADNLSATATELQNLVSRLKA
ncbi:MAG: methyl-accepting chemotaxis protein [Anaerobacillus sp.]|uniref:methyl-accepting chemotaxis protein n=1 Tax=Anaerobacillus sp. TaxID=1872506 RepID=UPI00391A18C2